MSIVRIAIIYTVALILFPACTSVVSPVANTELIIDGITVTARGSWYYRQTMYHGVVFETAVTLVVTNQSNEDLENLTAERITLYYENTEDDFATFVLADNSNTILAGTADTIRCINRDIYTTNIETGTTLYGCLELEWKDGNGRLATPASAVTVVYIR